MAEGGTRHEVAIEAIGARGDGVARLDAARIFVPLTLPGDRLRVRIAGVAATVWSASRSSGSSRRRAPRRPCPHFGACGGCQLQHLPPAQYGAWKRQQVAAALAQRGLEDIRVEPLVRTASRRPPARPVRVRPPGRDGSPRLRERTGHRVDRVDVCPVLVPELVALLPPLGALLARLDLARPAASSRRPRA